jgi:uncharacterized protein YpuA (DUF1002 family)
VSGVERRPAERAEIPMKASTFFRALVLLTALLLPARDVTGAGVKTIVYGADLTSTQRQELAQIFAAGPADHVETVTTPEMVTALQGTGLPVAPTDRSISSSALTCANSGAGLTVHTQNITRITAPVYANALVAAGAGDAAVSVAAPQGDPVTGETALVGVLKALPQCQAGKPLDARRVDIAYKQVAWTVALAGPAGDMNRAAAFMQQAAQAVIAGQAKDDASISSDIDTAAAAQGLTIDPSLRPGLTALLRSLGGLDYGADARGYRLQQTSPADVTALPAAPAPTAARAPGVNWSQRLPALLPDVLLLALLLWLLSRSPNAERSTERGSGTPVRVSPGVNDGRPR